MNRMLLSLGAVAALAIALIGCEAGVANNTVGATEDNNVNATPTNDATSETTGNATENGTADAANTVDRDGLVSIALNVKGIT